MNDTTHVTKPDIFVIITNDFSDPSHALLNKNYLFSAALNPGVFYLHLFGISNLNDNMFDQPDLKE